MRRNRQQQLFSEPYSGQIPMGGDSIRGRTVLGLVVNPKTKEPLLVVTDEINVGIRSVLEDRPLKKEGLGYYETGSDEATEITGFPRVHTPSGVEKKGMGYGTSLYTALCLGAHLTEEQEVEIEMNERGAGISSRTDNRSKQADRWWEAAKKAGLADEEVGEDKEEYVKLDADASDLESCDIGGYEGKIDYVNEVNVDLVVEQTAEYYAYVSAWKKDLVPAEIVLSEEIPFDLEPGMELDYLWEQIMDDPDLILSADTEGLLALDVRDLDERVVKLIAIAYMESGLGDKEVDSLWYRWKNRMDPQAKSPQQRLFSPNSRAAGLSDVLEARKIVAWDKLAHLP